jgi:VCBS repeat-containing protein
MTDNSIQLDSGGSILFVGNSYTFGRVDPVMSYNADNVRDLTAPVPGTSFANTIGSNVYEPHPWGGVPGLFEAFAEQAGLQLDVAISARNAATLQGQYLDSNPAGWDLRGNVASQSWDIVVLQDNSTQPLPSGAGSITFAAGSSTATLIIDPTPDTKMETDETIGIQVAANSAYRTSSGVVTGTILNDDPTGPVVNPALPTLTLVANPGAVLEDGSQNLVYTFTRTGPTTSALTVQFAATRDGSTAPSVAAGGDFENNANQFTTSFKADTGQQTTGSVSFTSNTGSVVIPAGATSVSFTLDPRPDTTVENDESIHLTLSANANYNVGTRGAVTATILNDDFAPGTDTSLPNISLSLASSAVFENGSGNLVYQFTRTGSNAAPLTVSFSVAGTATLPGNDFTVTGANSFSTPGAADPDLQSFNTYAVKFAQYATTGAADGAIPANPHADPATEVFLYETWARPNMITGAVVANANDTTGAITNTNTTAPEYYTSLEAMTADLRAAYEGLAAANPIFAGVAPVGAAFLNAVENGTAIRDPYTEAATDGKVDLWWDDNLHASKYGSYLSGLTLFGTITGLDPRSLGSAEHVAADLGITQAEAAALQNVAAATLGFTLDAHWTAPGQVTELPGGVTGLLASAGSFGFSDSDIADTHTIAVTPLMPGTVGTFTAVLHTDTTGDGTGGSINWLFTVDNAAVAFLAPGETRVEHFLVTISDANGGQARRDVAVTLNGSYNDAPVASDDVADAQVAGTSVNAPGVLGNDTDPEGDALVVSAVNGQGVNVGVSTAGTYGRLALFSDGHYSYVADNSMALALAPTGSHLHDIFNYTVSDGHGGTDSAALDITLNRAPVAAADTAVATTGIGGTASGNVLANDSDADGDGLAAVSGTVQGSHGTLVLGANGGYTYTVTNLTGSAGSHLHDILNYTVSDGHGGTASAALDVMLNRGSISANDSTAVAKGGTVHGNVLTNDSDPDGDAIGVASVAGGSVGHSIAGTYGSFTLNADGSYIYVAAKAGLPDQIVPQDTFTYAVSDGHGGNAQATVSFVVLNPGQSYQVGTNTTLNGSNGQDVVDGSSGHDIVLGGNGPDVLLGGKGDTLTGGNGPDTFLFRSGFGANTITDFDVHNDAVQIDKSMFQNMADLFAHASNSAAGAVINDGAGNAITFAGVTLADLQAHQSDFHLV